MKYERCNLIFKKNGKKITLDKIEWVPKKIPDFIPKKILGGVRDGRRIRK